MIDVHVFGLAVEQMIQETAMSASSLSGE
jgi:hypothetical protein